MIYRFEAFELDESRSELRHAGRVRPLPRRSFEVMRVLLEQAGRVVTKDEIFDRVWKNEHVGESVLPVHVRIIRRALGVRESAAIVHTVRGRGYMIACRVERVESAGPRALATGARRAPRRKGRVPRADALTALAQVTGMLSLALVLGDLDVDGGSLDWLDARDV
jgi:DNA-binding winged helix-turn-helix (wHTH) protein